MEGQRPVRDRASHRRRRDGRRLRGVRSRTRSGRRGQESAQVHAGGALPIQAGVPDSRRRSSPQPRASPRARGDPGRQRLFHDGAGQRHRFPDVRSQAGHAPRSAAGVAHHQRGAYASGAGHRAHSAQPGRRFDVCAAVAEDVAGRLRFASPRSAAARGGRAGAARRGKAAPRHQTVERARRTGWAGGDLGLRGRDRPLAPHRPEPHRGGRGRGHGSVHGAGASDGRGADAGFGLVQRRRRPLRGPRRTGALRRLGDGRAHDESCERSGAACQVRRGRAHRARRVVSRAARSRRCEAADRVGDLEATRDHAEPSAGPAVAACRRSGARHGPGRTRAATPGLARRVRAGPLRACRHGPRRRVVGHGQVRRGPALSRRVGRARRGACAARSRLRARIGPVQGR